jgi:radical SAM superfamily enzyme YgiQ (UPF0313 family)
MKKVLLLSTNQADTPYPVPPLGLALLYQRLHIGYQVRLLDGFLLSSDGLRRHLQDFQPDYIGLSIRNIDDMVKGSTHSYIPGILETYLIPIKEQSRAVLILGGAGFTIFPDELMAVFGADFGIIGEADDALPLLLAAIEQGDDPSQIVGVVLPGKTSRARDAAGYLPLNTSFSSDLDTLLDYAPYSERSAYPIQTKRGCGHSCIYCSYPILEGRTFRRRNVAHVVDEIEKTRGRIENPGLIFEFVDSTFNDPPGHAEAICKEIIRRNLKVALRTMGMNPVNISGNLLGLMRQAGFVQIDSTPDSASPVMLTNYQKNFTIGHLRKAARLIREHEMPTMWFFIFGGPGETEETLLESFAFIDDYVYENDMVNITEGMRIYPRTPLADLAVKEGIINKETSLLAPLFYVSPQLGDEKLTDLVSREIATRPNCIRLTESRPPPMLLQAAIRERKEKNLTEPMFRTLLRLKRLEYQAENVNLIRRGSTDKLLPS